jgi:hypothetical protein
VTDEQTLMDAVDPEPARRRRFSRRAVWWVAAVTVVVLLCGWVLFDNTYLRARRIAATNQREAEGAASVGNAAHAGSWTDAKRVLDEQAAALLRGDERGWLSAVDPKRPDLRDQYHRLFVSLRALGVSGWSYHVAVPPVTTYGRAGLDTDVTVAYCLNTSSCPAYDPVGDGQPPVIKQHLAMTRPKNKPYVITGLQDRPGSGQPAPWESGRLVFAQGKRVTVAAAPGQEGRLQEVLAAADQAATSADAYAKYLNSPQRRYRVYLAGDQEWNTWFGGSGDAWAIGLAVGLGQSARTSC